MTPTDMKAISAWMTAIGESSPDTINRVLASCEADPSALAYFLARASHEGEPSMKEISTALVRAQKNFGPAIRNAANPHFRSRYADLAACLDAVQPALNEAGIAVLQKAVPCDAGVAVETVFMHESGETISCGTFHVPAAKNDPQGYGSALTYARRYSLMAACGIAPEDDDGNAASAPQRPAPASARKEPAKAPDLPPENDPPPPIEQVLSMIGSANTAADARSIGLNHYKRFDADAQASIKAAVEQRKAEVAE